MTGPLDGRGGMRTTPPEGVGLCSAPSIERPSVDRQQAGDTYDWRQSSLAAPPPADGRSVLCDGTLAERGSVGDPCWTRDDQLAAEQSRPMLAPSPRSANAHQAMLRAFLAWQKTQPQHALDLEV